MDINSIQRNVAAVADRWSPELAARLERSALDKADFATLGDAGLTLTGVPEEMGGVWHSVRAVDASDRCDFSRARPGRSFGRVGGDHASQRVAFWHVKPVEPPIDPVAWRQQRDHLLTAAKAGHWVGTISSEPGGGVI